MNLKGTLERYWKDAEEFFNVLMRGAADSDGATLYGLAPQNITKDVYIASAIINTLALALPITILQVYDRVLPNNSTTTLNALIIGLFLVIAIDAALKYLRSYVMNWNAASYTHRLSRTALQTTLKTPPAIYRRNPASEHMERLNAIGSFGDYIGGSSRFVGIDLLFIPVFALVIMLIGGWLFVAPLILFGVFSMLCVYRAKALRALIEEREKMDSRKSDLIIESLSSMATIKAMAMEPLIMRRFERLQLQISDIVRQTIRLTNAAQTHAALYASISTVSVVGFGAILVIQEQLSMGAMACCMLLSSQMLQPLMRTLSAWNEIQLATLNRERIEHIFDDAEPIYEMQFDDRLQKAIAIRRPAKITFSDVTIQYGDAPALFEHLNLTIEGGSVVAFRGEDGSGRSSILRLMAGASYPHAGNVTIGGIKAQQVYCATLRHYVRYIQQEPQLFRGTILENITLFGRVPVEDCLYATRLIGLDEDICRMPMGYDTPLRGAGTSEIPASTAQRIAIARALADRPAVLILDEANTCLDIASEKKLMDAIAQLKGDTTVIIATHRPSILRSADQSFDVANGAIWPINWDQPTREKVSR